MAIPTLDQWKKDTSRWWIKRSTELKAVDDALDDYNISKTPKNFLLLADALKDWMESKTDWIKSTRNVGGNADVVMNLVRDIAYSDLLGDTSATAIFFKEYRNILRKGYKEIKKNLQDQIQGTCGIYSFYNAVCILRELNHQNPHVPPPKKSYGKKYANDSLRAYSKRQLQSGQGEILDELEMKGLIEAHGYTTNIFDRSDNSLTKRKEFIDDCMKAGYPVLIAYLADNTVKYTTTLKDSGAHWSLIIGVTANYAEVIEPNVPKDLKVWPIDDLLRSNAMCDQVTFARYWEKTSGGSINEIGNKVGRNWTSPHHKRKTPYDLGGDTGHRHQNQNLDNVLIAIVPPYGVF